ncbi:hypothetical protein ACFQUU_08550 [Herbaspirillum sp. GCM10030257]|uniref:hypothetical protein n=1 Tax=Herbaspirillum sp. GCM10030257 TaxID=3273393 RepID=UPI00360F4815
MIAAYPLQWPAGWPRTPAQARQSARFNKKTTTRHKWSDGSTSTFRGKQGLSVADGVERVLSELQRFGVDRQDIVISTNVRTRLDGLPRSGEREPDDTGAAAYWQTRAGERRVMAIDQYETVADNLAAIAATLEAMRSIERHGGAQILDRAFTGFAALSAPGTVRTWREVFGFITDAAVSMDRLKAEYRTLASSRHPDKGGSHEAMTELNIAYEQAKQEIKA